MQNSKYKRLKCANSRDHQSETMLFSLVNNYLTIYIHTTQTLMSVQYFTVQNTAVTFHYHNITHMCLFEPLKRPDV